jgi:hypothetical protein
VLEGHNVFVNETGDWRGLVIAEGLYDQALINDLQVTNDLRVTKVFITRPEHPVDEGGTQGCWHLYWVDVLDDQIDQVIERLRAGTRHACYTHFWQDDRLLVVYNDKRFEMRRHDQASWQPAIDHGLAQGLPLEDLDFPTDDSPGTLA